MTFCLTYVIERYCWLVSATSWVRLQKEALMGFCMDSLELCRGSKGGYGSSLSQTLDFGSQLLAVGFFPEPKNCLYKKLSWLKFSQQLKLCKKWGARLKKVPPSWHLETLHLNLRLWCLSCSSYVARSLTALEMHSTGHTIFSVGSRVTLVGWVKDQTTESCNYKEPHDVLLFLWYLQLLQKCL